MIAISVPLTRINLFFAIIVFFSIYPVFEKIYPVGAENSKFPARMTKNYFFQIDVLSVGRASTKFQTNSKFKRGGTGGLTTSD
jgi:hypothetical protein